jgi:hypothetical protein
MVGYLLVEVIAMTHVGDRIVVTSKGAPRSGVVIATSGDMITVRWDTGGETSLIPGPGVLSVVAGGRKAPSPRTRPATSGGANAARRATVAHARSGRAGKAASGTAVAAGKKSKAGGTPSRRTAGKKAK